MPPQILFGKSQGLNKHWSTFSVEEVFARGKEMCREIRHDFGMESARVFVGYVHACWIRCEVGCFQGQAGLLASEGIYWKDAGGGKCFLLG